MSHRLWPGPWDDPFGCDVRRQSFIRFPDRGAWRRLANSSDDEDTVAVHQHYRPEMRFRLTYDGLLHSGQGESSKGEKFFVRYALQPQLEELWSAHPVLLGYGFRDGGEYEADVRANEQGLLRQWIEVEGQPYLAVARKDLELTCSLDILFLRKDGPGAILSDPTDIDNRLGTFFDGLCPPTSNEPVPSSEKCRERGIETPLRLPNPFRCLLEDDRMISSLAVRTDRLLSRPSANRHEVRLVVDVVISPIRLRNRNLAFLGD